MNCILHIETSTDSTSVALSQGGAILAEEEVREAMRAATDAAPMADRMLSFADSHAIPLDAVAVSAGPGSYTGLRIGTSLAKGLAYGRGAKLLSVPTLELLCVPILLGEEIPEDALLLPMLDARRMEVYAAIYDRALRPVRETGADIVDANTYREYLDQHPVYFFGNGAGKCMETINHPNAHYIDGVEPLAKWMQPLADRRWLNGQTEDVAYFVPYYLKDFVAKMPKKLI